MAFKVQLIKELEIEIDGKLFKVREPSMEELQSYVEKTSGHEDNQKAMIQHARDFVDSLGFPSEYHSMMSWYGLRDLIGFLTQEKKS